MKHDAVVRISLLLIASIVTLAALYYSQGIMAPVTFALFTVAIAWPLQSALQKRIPVLLALVVTMVVALAVLAILIFLVVWGFGLVFQWVSTAFKHFMRKQRNGLIATAYQSPILWPTATIPDGSLARPGGWRQELRSRIFHRHCLCLHCARTAGSRYRVGFARRT
jgi:predicted PurR-regulated permease PerM